MTAPALTPAPEPSPAPTEPIAPGSAPAPVSEPAPEPVAVPEPVASEAVTPTADGIKEAVSDRSEAMGGVVETLDAWALSVGDMRVSLWDAMVLLMVIGTIIAAAWFISKLAHAGLRRMSGLDPSQRVLAEKLVTLGVWALAILIGIDLLSIDLTALAVFSGAFGLAIGFGLQKTFGNLIAGIILLLDKSIKPGDVIAVSDQAGNSTFGEIRKIGIRAVSITTRDQKEYLIPNENLMVNQVENWSYSSKNVRMQVPVGVGYNCDIKLAEKLMLQAAAASERVLTSPPPTVWLDQYGENSVDFVIHCWITDPEAGIGNIRSEVLKRLWGLFQENGIEIPFPQRDINLRNNAQFEQLIAALAQRMDGYRDGQES